jgi:hypothetical protein
LKIIVPVIVLFGAFAVQPGIAKDRFYHTETKGKHGKAGATAGNAATAKGASAKGVNSVSKPLSDTSNAGVTVLSPRAGNAADKTRNPGVSVKVAKPVNFQTHNISAPVGPVARNAIGQIVARPQNVTASGEHSGAPAQTTITRSSGMAEAGGASTINRQNPRPVATASNVGSGKIDGAGLIRPTTASGLGGPAKTAGGINGTNLRSRY